MKKNEDYEVPEELQQKLKSSPFKRSILSINARTSTSISILFSQAKRSQTRYNRIDKYMNAILQGKGMNDK